MKKIGILSIILSFLLTSCMLPPLWEAKAQLSASKVCCKRFSEITYTDLKINSEIEVTLDKQSPSYVFDTGKSFFASFKLPKFNKNTVFTIKSYFARDVFYPTLTLLDNKYNITRVITKPEIKHIRPSGVEDGRIEGVVVLTPESKERYIIIHTTNELIGDYIERRLGWDAYTHEFSTVGNMSISLMQKTKS